MVQQPSKYRRKGGAPCIWCVLLALFTLLWAVAPTAVWAEENSEEVTSLSFSKPSLVVRTGEQEQLPDLLAKYASGDVRTVSAEEAEYEVADPDVVRVEVSEGRARLVGQSAGYTKLTARYANHEAALFVFVSDLSPEVRW